jgi:RimJ/RimL family protein N-acetyltransferase
VPAEREPAEPVGLGLRGWWIELEPQSSANTADFGAFANRRELSAEMGGGTGGASEFAPPMLIRDLRSGRAVGVVDNSGLPGGVTVVAIYLDPEHGRAGWGMEAITLYVTYLFDQGARLVTAEVLGFNAAMIGVLRTLKIEPQARLREHAYVAGRYWDVLVYSFDRTEWVTKVVERYRDRLPGGWRRPAAIGALRRKS